MEKGVYVAADYDAGAVCEYGWVIGGGPTRIGPFEPRYFSSRPASAVSLRQK
jgi:hypothetical protein